MDFLHTIGLNSSSDQSLTKGMHSDQKSIHFWITVRTNYWKQKTTLPFPGEFAWSPFPFEMKLKAQLPHPTPSYLSGLLEVALLLMEWHLVFPGDSQSCVWLSLVKASTKQSPLENSKPDNHIAKIKKADISSKCLQVNHFGRLVNRDREFLVWTITKAAQ